MWPKNICKDINNMWTNKSTGNYHNTHMIKNMFKTLFLAYTDANTYADHDVTFLHNKALNMFRWATDEDIWLLNAPGWKYVARVGMKVVATRTKENEAMIMGISKQFAEGQS